MNDKVFVVFDNFTVGVFVAKQPPVLVHPTQPLAYSQVAIAASADSLYVAALGMSKDTVTVDKIILATNVRTTTTATAQGILSIAVLSTGDVLAVQKACVQFLVDFCESLVDISSLVITR